MKCYVPSGKTREGAVANMLVFGLLATIVTSILLGVLTHWFDIILIFAGLAGAVVGLGVKTGARRAHCRNPRLIAVLALSLGALVYVGKLYVNSLVAQWRVKENIAVMLQKKAGGAVDGAKLDAAVDTLFVAWQKKETGTTGFGAYLSQLAKEGISIGSRGGGLNIGFIGTIIMLLLEAAAAAAASWGVASSLSDEPYCEDCSAWISETWKTVTKTDEVKGLAALIAEETLQENQARGLLFDLPDGSADPEKGRLELRECKGCGQGFLSGFYVRPTPGGKKGQITTEVAFSNVVLTRGELLALRDETGNVEPCSTLLSSPSEG